MYFAGITRRIRPVTDRLQRHLRLGNYWYWLPAEATPVSLPIAPLIYPLRYDVLVRRSFFAMYGDNRGLYRDDPARFLKLAQGHEYFTWFSRILVKRYMPQSRHGPAEVERMFARRVRASVELYENISEHGFDARRPIVPYTGETILASTSGARSAERFFVGDGCHRLACMMEQGVTELPRSMVRVRCFRRLCPFDNTSLLREYMDIEWPEEFLPGVRG